jgi:DNA invertase Pin-like site-specific DNA recombinase
MARPKESTKLKPDKDLEEIKKLLSLGVPKAVIARGLKVSYSTLTRFLKKHNLS